MPGFRGLVPRFTRLRYEGFDPAGKRIARDVDGFHARVVQHECDHLDGILYPMRIRDLREFGFTDVLFPETGGRRRVGTARRSARRDAGDGDRISPAPARVVARLTS